MGCALLAAAPELLLFVCQALAPALIDPLLLIGSVGVFSSSASPTVC